MKNSRISRKSVVALSAAICCMPSLMPNLASADSIYTDSLVDYAGGSATAPVYTDSYMDLASVVITNNSTNIFFQINLNPTVTTGAGTQNTDLNLTAQSYGKYQIGMETSPGAGLVTTPSTVSNPYNPIGISTGMNYWIDNWTNQGGGGTDADPDTGDASVWGYSGGAWNQTAGNGLAGDVSTVPSQFTQTTLTMTSITTSVPLAALGLSIGQQFNFDVWSTYDGGVGAVDALDSGAAATSESSGTYVNPYSSPPTPYDSATAPGSTESTTIYGVVTPTFTWNDSTAGAGYYDGTTWDVNDNTKYNWNNGIFADYYTDNINVVFSDVNNGNYNVNLTAAVNPASIVVNNSLGNYVISGTGSIGGTGSLTKMGSSTLTLSTSNTYSGGTNVSAGLLIIAPTSTPATTSALPKGALTITGGEVQLATGVTAGSQSANPPVTKPASSVNITSLSISGTGTLDITNNHIIIDYSGLATAPIIGSIAAWIASGYNHNTWTGIGITSSTAAGNLGKYGIGYAASSDPGNPAGLSSGQIEIKYTLLGDTNLDGKVNGTDFTILATNFNQSGKAWDQGDFNYDGKVNGSDFLLLASNFNQSASGSAVAGDDLAALDAFAAANGMSLASVPEPASMGLILVAGLGVLARRRRSLAGRR